MLRDIFGVSEVFFYLEKVCCNKHPIVAFELNGMLTTQSYLPILPLSPSPQVFYESYLVSCVWPISSELRSSLDFLPSSLQPPRVVITKARTTTPRLYRKAGDTGPDGGYESATSSTESVSGDGRWWI